MIYIVLYVGWALCIHNSQEWKKFLIKHVRKSIYANASIFKQHATYRFFVVFCLYQFFLYNCIRLNEIELSTISKSLMLLVDVCIVVTQILLKRLENYFIFLTPSFKNVFWIIRACSFNVFFFLLIYVYVIYQSTSFMFESYLIMTVECFHISNRNRLFYGNQMHRCIYIIIYNQVGQSCTCFTCFPN